MKGLTHIYTLVLCLFASLAQGQTTGLDWSNLEAESNRLAGKITGKVYYISALDNTTFLVPSEWVVGDVVLNDGDIHEGLKLRYHVLKDELIAYNERSSNLYYVEKDQVNSFTMLDGKRQRDFLKIYKEEEQKNSQYYEVLFNGSQKFLARRYIYEKKVQPYADKMGIMRDVEYETRTQYFGYATEAGLHRLSLNRRSLLLAYPSHKKAIKKILRKNGIIIHDERTMIRAFALLNENNLLQ